MTTQNQINGISAHQEARKQGPTQHLLTTYVPVSYLPTITVIAMID